MDILGPIRVIWAGLELLEALRYQMADYDFVIYSYSAPWKITYGYARMKVINLTNSSYIYKCYI